jgi:hypothetical protein
MKKTTLFAFALLAISFASCKKDYTCVCTDNSNGSTTFTGVFHASNSDAKKSCTAIQSSGETCSIK